MGEADGCKLGVDSKYFIYSVALALFIKG